ncbi:hypothetical protein RB195_019115 [Necator americanus]|uniref:Reverse transcriptase domain-containing protein n=1 Tax=Necator americanus TaxID=51031 RepID=A0ABR1CEP4_NECAM
MTALRNPKGTAIASRKGMEKIIYDFYSDLFDSHVHLPPHHLREDGRVIPEILPSEIRHTIMSVRNRTAPGLDVIRPENLKNLPPVLIDINLALSLHVICRNARFLNSGRPARPCCCMRREIHMTSVTIAQSAYCPSSKSSLQRTISNIYTASKLTEVSRECKIPLCFTFVDLKKFFHSVEREAIMEDQGVPTQNDTGTTGSIPTELESEAESTKDDVHAQRMDLGCPIHAQQNECTSYVYLGRKLNMMNDLTPYLGRRRRAAWGAYKSIEDVMKKSRNTRLRAHLFNTTILPALKNGHVASRKKTRCYVQEGGREIHMRDEHEISVLFAQSSERSRNREQQVTDVADPDAAPPTQHVPNWSPRIKTMNFRKQFFNVIQTPVLEDTAQCVDLIRVLRGVLGTISRVGEERGGV